ncbi:hypothetical protein EVAR_51761_1 [Eumeta japonica]|uniref:Uncharacterized protein n=1 Tax=Eumeta variegata TaxID=151549 RepID=A0A4C1XAZ8_EUMVA|nr:hypothetical protein EVAR_51761_1 [Eumeta japonica]
MDKLTSHTSTHLLKFMESEVQDADEACPVAGHVAVITLGLFDCATAVSDLQKRKVEATREKYPITAAHQGSSTESPIGGYTVLDTLAVSAAAEHGAGTLRIKLRGGPMFSCGRPRTVTDHINN